MRLSTVLGCVLLVGLVVGCVSGPSSNWTMTTSSNGVVTGVQQVEAPEAVALDPTKFDIQIKDGKVAWRVDVQNDTAFRAMVMGVFTSVTEPAGTLELKFSGTVNAKSSQVFSANTAIEGGLPAELKIVRTNAAIIPGAGCETPTTHIPGNWPEQALQATAVFTPVAQRAVLRPKVIPAPVVSTEISGIEVDDKGGKKFFWTLTCQNMEDVSVDLTYTTTWTLDTGERVIPSVISFVLKGGERRVLDGAPVRTKTQFRSVSGETKLTGKKYIK